MMVASVNSRRGLKDSGSALKRFGSRVAYKIFGPTTIHLDHEVCLLVTATCLTSASLFSLYKLSFGTARDFFYLIVSTLWLSRHFFHRLICTTDVSTSLSSWTHNLRWIWITITSGGQYFDIPTSVFASTSFQSLFDDTYASSISGADVSSTTHIPVAYSPLAFHRFRIVQSTLIPILAAIWVVLQKCKLSSGTSNTFDIDDEDWSTTSTLTATANNKRNKHSSHNGNGNGNGSENKPGKKNPSFAESHKKCMKTLNRKFDRWWQYVPRIQMLVLIVAICGMIWFFQRYNEALSSYALPLRTPRSAVFDTGMANPRTASTGTLAKQHHDATIAGSELVHKRFLDRSSSVLWSRYFVHSPFGILCMIVSLGTFGSILLFARIMPPLPDLVGSSGGNYYKGGHKSSKSQKSNKAWSEQYRSIVEENRFHLHFKVLLLRVFEYVLLCAMLPRSEFICRATGHCDVDPMIFESGNPTLVNETGKSMYSDLIRDRFQDALITTTVIVATTLMLVSQMIVLDKSYLALKSYSKQETSAVRKSSGGSKRKSLKHPDAVTFDFSGDMNGIRGQRSGMVARIFKISESIEKYCGELFGNELGALSTSRILSIGANIHVGYTLFVIIVWIYYAASGGNWYCFFLIYLSLFSSAVEVGYLEPSELNDIADEINAVYSMKTHHE